MLKKYQKNAKKCDFLVFFIIFCQFLIIFYLKNLFPFCCRKIKYFGNLIKNIFFDFCRIKKYFLFFDVFLVTNLTFFKPLFYNYIYKNLLCVDTKSWRTI